VWFLTYAIGQTDSHTDTLIAVLRTSPGYIINSGLHGCTQEGLRGSLVLLARQLGKHKLITGIQNWGTNHSSVFSQPMKCAIPTRSLWKQKRQLKAHHTLQYWYHELLGIDTGKQEMENPRKTGHCCNFSCGI